MAWEAKGGMLPWKNFEIWNIGDTIFMVSRGYILDNANMNWKKGGSAKPIKAPLDPPQHYTQSVVTSLMANWPQQNVGTRCQLPHPPPAPIQWFVHYCGWSSWSDFKIQQEPWQWIFHWISVTVIEVLPKDKKGKEEKTNVLGQSCVDLLPLLQGEISSQVLQSKFFILQIGLFACHTVSQAIHPLAGETKFSVVQAIHPTVQPAEPVTEQVLVSFKSINWSYFLVSYCICMYSIDPTKDLTWILTGSLQYTTQGSWHHTKILQESSKGSLQDICLCSSQDPCKILWSWSLPPRILQVGG